MNKYYFFYKCYWSYCRNSKCKFKSCVCKKKKHNIIVTLAKTKLTSVETLLSQALIDPGISHEKIKTFVNEKEKYDKMKENIRNIKNNDKKDVLSRNNKENSENLSS